MKKMNDPKVTINLSGDLKLYGKKILNSQKYLHELKGIFQDIDAFNKHNPQQLVYEVQAYMPVEEGRKGGLFFGNSLIYPGKVGSEYFMTRGHFHKKLDTAEFYWCIKGKGALIYMDTKRNCWLEWMYPGSLHYINGDMAHRVANIGDDILFFNACWSSDAGYDYDSIEDYGFCSRLLEIDGKPLLVSD